MKYYFNKIKSLNKTTQVYRILKINKLINMV